MSASERTRKILWAKAGGRCSICRVLLVTEGTETDDPSVFGQEAHIISGKADGPRHAYLPNFDVYSNLPRSMRASGPGARRRARAARASGTWPACARGRTSGACRRRAL
jgi:hypothetical protein